MNRTRKEWEEYKPPSMGMVSEIDTIRDAREDILALHKIIEDCVDMIHMSIRAAIKDKNKCIGLVH